MKTLLIVWHSRTGGAEQMARAAEEAAAQDAEVRVVRRCAADAGPDDMQHADGYVFVAPENLASLSGEMKEFFDRNYYPLLDRINGRPYALLICAGSDGTGAERQMRRICTGWRLREVAPAVIVNTDAQTADKILAPKLIAPDQLARCAEVGAALAAGLAAGVF